MILPKALSGIQRMVCLNVIPYLLLGNSLPSKDQVAKLGPVVRVGLDWGFGHKETGAMGHVVESKFKAQMDMGTMVPYISPPLICARLLGRIKESKRHLLSKKLNRWKLG